MQAFVYALNRELQRAYIDAEPRVRRPAPHGGKGKVLGREFDVHRPRGDGPAARAAAEASPENAQIADFVHVAGSRWRRRSRAPGDRLARSPSSGARARSHVGLSAQVQAYGLTLTVGLLGLLLAAGSLAAERDENVVGRLARGLSRLGELVAGEDRARRGGRARARARDPDARVRHRGRDRRTSAAASRGSACRSSRSARARRAPRSARSGASSPRSRARRARPRSPRGLALPLAFVAVVPSDAVPVAGGIATRSRSRTPCASSPRRSTTGRRGATLAVEAAWLVGLDARAVALARSRAAPGCLALAA